MEIGQRIKLFRQNAGMSREELAKKVTLSKFAISKYEQGQRMPSIGILNKIAAALGVSIEDLLNYKPLSSHSTSYINKDGKITEVINQRNIYIPINPSNECNVSYPEKIEKEKLKQFDDEIGVLSAINLLTSEANKQNFVLGETKALIDELRRTAKNLITIAKMERGSAIPTDDTLLLITTHDNDKKEDKSYLEPIAAHNDDLTDDEKDLMQKRIKEYEQTTNKDK